MKIYILLGRAGDIINVLPAIEYEAREKKYKPFLVIAEAYRELLEGVAYVSPIVWKGDFRDINKALPLIREQYPGYEIVDCTVYGINYSFKVECNSFTKEIWKRSGCPIAFGRIPVNFDLRDMERERELIELIK